MGVFDLVRSLVPGRDSGRGSRFGAGNPFREIEIQATQIRASSAGLEAEALRVAMLARMARPARGGSRAWDPTVAGPLWTDFLGDWSSADEEIRRRLKPARERSRRLARSNPYASRFFSLYLGNVIGEDGLQMKPRAKRLDGSPDELANTRLLDEWVAWGERGNCTLDGAYTWRELEDILAVSWQRDGEALLRLMRGPKFGRWGFVVEPIEADQLDLDYSTAAGENEIRMGVEYVRQTGQVVAYWILNAHPGDLTISRGSVHRTRVPASDLIHLFSRERIGQHRGVPRLDVGMSRLHMLAGYEEAELVAARASSSKIGAVTTEAGEWAGDDLSGKTPDGGTPDAVYSDFSAGTLMNLPAGAKVDFFDPTHPTTQYEAAIKAFLRGFSASTPAGYHSIANDLENVNYSSLRHGTLEERDQWKREQKQFAKVVCQPVLENWLDVSLLSGALDPLTPNGFDRYRRVVWSGKRWAWIDPGKEAAANAASIPFYGKTVTEIVQERGRTVREVADEIAEERKIFEELGLVHPLDRPIVGGPPPVATDPNAPTPPSSSEE